MKNLPVGQAFGFARLGIAGAGAQALDVMGIEIGAAAASDRSPVLTASTKHLCSSRARRDRCHESDGRVDRADRAGALVQIILGLRTSGARGGAVVPHRNVILGMLLVGVLWLIIDCLVFVPLERATVLKWG